EGGRLARQGEALVAGGRAVRVHRGRVGDSHLTASFGGGDGLWPLPHCAALLRFASVLAHTGSASRSGGVSTASGLSARSAERRSNSGLSDRTSGRTSKLWGGGGDVVAHSRVSPSHGSASASRPRRATMLTKT